MTSSETTIVFTGDIGFDRYMAGKWTDQDLIARELLQFIGSADHVVANVEGAMIRQEEAEDVRNKGIFFHTMNPEAIAFLKYISADIWNLANNHTMDGGMPGIRNTIKLAKSMGSQTVGAGENLAHAMKPVILPEAGGIGIVSVGYMPDCVRATKTEAGVLAWDELEHIAECIRKVKKKCRWCVLVVHGGEEFTCLPAPYTRNLYHNYLLFGADIVVSHHPHVPMNYETIGEKAIFYSLGNLIFDTDYQRAQYNTDTGILLKLKFTKNAWSFEPQAYRIVRGEECLVSCEPAAIFTDIGEEEYQKLMPTAAKAFLCNEKKRKGVIDKRDWTSYTEKEWEQYIHDFATHPERVPGWELDLPVYAALAAAADPEVFESSKLYGVKEYIRKQIP